MLGAAASVSRVLTEAALLRHGTKYCPVLMVCATASVHGV